MAPGMCRIRIAAALLASLALGGCSLILDFDPPGEGPPIDAAVSDERCTAFEPNDELAQATPIGVACRVCERADCAQRAHPPLSQRLRIDENVRRASPFAFSAG